MRMSDHQAADDFGAMFKALAKFPKTPQRQKFAQLLWKLSFDHDFWPGDMRVDKELVELGLAQTRKTSEGLDRVWYAGLRRGSWIPGDDPGEE